MGSNAVQDRSGLDDRAQIDRARRLIMARRYAESLALLREVGARRPADLEVRFLAAVAQQQSGAPQDALDLLRSIGRLAQPRHMIVWGRALRDLGNTQEALDAYRWALVLDPRMVESAEGVVAMQHALVPDARPDPVLVARAALIRRSTLKEAGWTLESLITLLTAEVLWNHGSRREAIGVLHSHAAVEPTDLTILMRGAIYAFAQRHFDDLAVFWNSSDLLNAALFARDGAVVFDIGMRGGMVADMHLGFGAAAVHGFEPEPRAAQNIRRIYASDDNVILHEMALAASPGQLPLLVPEENPGAATLDRSFAAMIDRSRSTRWEKVFVEVRRLDDFDLPRADFWKIDVEGLEDAVLDGAEQTLRRAKPEGVQVEAFLNEDGLYKETVARLRRHFRHVWTVGGTTEGRPISFDLPVPAEREAELLAAVRRVATPILTASDRPLSQLLSDVDLQRLFDRRQSWLDNPGPASRFETFAADVRQTLLDR